MLRVWSKVLQTLSIHIYIYILHIKANDGKRCWRKNGLHLSACWNQTPVGSTGASKCLEVTKNTTHLSHCVKLAKWSCNWLQLTCNLFCKDLSSSVLGKWIFLWPSRHDSVSRRPSHSQVVAARAPSCIKIPRPGRQVRIAASGKRPIVAVFIHAMNSWW